MRILYTNRLSPGFRTIKLDGSDEIVWDLPQEHLGLISNNVFPSPDGTKILYYLFSSRDVNRSSIWLINSDGSGLHPLIESSPDNNWYPIVAFWSPDGGQIAYMRVSWVVGDLKIRELWLIGVDGSNHHIIAYDENLIDASINPFWALNGYIYLTNTQHKLYAVDPQAGVLYKLMDEVDPLYLRFSLAPDGEHAINMGTVTTQQLQSAVFDVLDLTGEFGGWSPDGSQVVYSNEQGIWLLDIETNEGRLLLPGDATYTIQVHGFSPDGHYVAYQTDEGIFVIDIESPTAQSWMVVADPLDENQNQVIRFKAWIPMP